MDKKFLPYIYAFVTFLILLFLRLEIYSRKLHFVHYAPLELVLKISIGFAFIFALIVFFVLSKYQKWWLLIGIIMLGIVIQTFAYTNNQRFTNLPIPDPELNADKSNPIVLINDTMEILFNRSLSIPIQYYSINKESEVYPYLMCPTNSTGNDYSNFTVFVGVSKPMEAGEQKKFILLIPAGFTNDIICTLYFTNDLKRPTGNLPINILNSKQITFVPS